MMQTNGILLDRLPPEIVNRFVTLLVSLDGTRELTDANRGTGVYDRVMENIRKIRAQRIFRRTDRPDDGNGENRYCGGGSPSCIKPGLLLLLHPLAG